MSMHGTSRSKTEATWIGPVEITWDERCWVARGPVPLAVAEELYAHPIGHTTISLDGDCNCPAPSEHRVAWFTPDGRRVYRFERAPDQEAMSPLMLQICEKYSPWVVFHDQPCEIAAGYVQLYHLNGDDALALFERSCACVASTKPFGRRGGISGSARIEASWNLAALAWEPLNQWTIPTAAMSLNHSGGPLL